MRTGAPPPTKRIELSPSREASLTLAIDRFVDARRDQAEFDRSGQELIDLNRRLYLEQIAEQALASDEPQARARALRIAAHIVDDLTESCALPPPATPQVAVIPDVCIAVLNAYARALEADRAA